MQTIYGSINWHKIKNYNMIIPGSEIKQKTSYSVLPFQSCERTMGVASFYKAGVTVDRWTIILIVVSPEKRAIL